MDGALYDFMMSLLFRPPRIGVRLYVPPKHRRLRTEGVCENRLGRTKFG